MLTIIIKCKLILFLITTNEELTMEKNKTSKAMAAAFLANVIFGFSFIFSKMGLSAATPSILLAYRFVTALLVMTVLILTKTVEFDIKGKNIMPLLLIGLFQPVIYFICESYGLMYTTATFSAVMIALVPIASLLFGSVFLREIPSVMQVIFSLISISGVVLMALQESSEGSVKLIGIFLLIGAIASAVGFNVTSRKYSSQFSAFERTYFMFLIGGIFFSIMAVAENFGHFERFTAPLSSPMFIISVFYLSILSSIAAFLMMNYSTTYLSVARTTSFSNIITVVSVFAGIVFLHEGADIVSIISSIMIIVGVWGVQKMGLKNEK